MGGKNMFCKRRGVGIPCTFCYPCSSFVSSAALLPRARLCSAHTDTASLPPRAHALTHTHNRLSHASVAVNNKWQRAASAAWLGLSSSSAVLYCCWLSTLLCTAPVAPASPSSCLLGLRHHTGRISLSSGGGGTGREGARVRWTGEIQSKRFKVPGLASLVLPFSSVTRREVYGFPEV